MVGVAAPERAVFTNDAPAAADLSPTKEAMQAAFPVITPATLPAENEELETILEGSIPGWLSGSIIRNGGGAFSAEMKHSFDGFATLVKFRFKDGKVFMNRRFLETNTFKAFKKSGKLSSVEFGTIPSLTLILWSIVKGALQGKQPDFTDNASVNTYGLPGGKEMVAMTEAVTGTVRVNVTTLDTLDRFEYSDDVSALLTTAHPVIYPHGSIYNIFSNIGGKRIVARIDPKTQTRTEIANVPADHALNPPWIHDLPGSENYILVPDTPTVMDFGLKTILKGRSEYATMKWMPGKQKTKVHIVPKNGGQVKTVECPFDFMAFHYANAFESKDGKEVYLDAPLYKDPSAVDHLYLDNLHNSKEYAKNTVSRITLPLDGSEASLRTLVPTDEYTSTELPRINPNFKFRDYQFIYGTSYKLPTSFANAVSKMDVKNGSSKQWYEANCLTTEPLMLPKPGATEEDDGVVTSMCIGADGKGFLLILDAKSFKEIARAKLPYDLPYGFHNQHYPEI